MNSNKSKRTHRIQRHARIRARLFGSSQKPRVSIFKSNQHIRVQFIDDSIVSKTVLSGSTMLDKSKGNKTKLAESLGEKLGKAAIDKGIKEIIFDKSGYKYHGRIKSLADGLRKSGLKF